eukprot:473600-Prorocentrum_minimum.AAC.1
MMMIGIGGGSEGDQRGTLAAGGVVELEEVGPPSPPRAVGRQQRVAQLLHLRRARIRRRVAAGRDVEYDIGRGRAVHAEGVGLRQVAHRVQDLRPEGALRGGE